MKLLKLAAAMIVAVALAACASTAGKVDTTDAAKGAYAAKASYGVALVAATAYARLPRCGQPTSPPLCSDTAVLEQMKKADLAADTATQSAENAVRSLKDPTLVQAAVVAATGAVKAFKDITDVYSPK